jgi:cyclopropane-fatty-acyl-phospholipid synthase
MLRISTAGRNEVLCIFSEVYSEKQAQLWLTRWRIFFMACAGFFGCNNGQEWIVSHYLFEVASV